MSSDQHSTYEGMFVFPQSVTGNLGDAADHVRGILEKNQATILSFKKWDERRFAYEMGGFKRGVYFLAYFTAASDALVGIERDCNLSEQLLRNLVLKADHVPEETIEAAEGSAELADEIALRSKEATEGAAAGGSAVSRREEEAPKAAEKAPAEDAPAEEPVAEEAPAEDAPAEEAPAEEAPAEDAPAEEPVAEEAPAEEASSEEASDEGDDADAKPAEATTES